MVVVGRASIRRANSVVLRMIVGEHLLIPISNHIDGMAQMYAINDVGAEIWDRLDGRPESELIDGICDVFDVERQRAAVEVRQFLDLLVNSGLAVSMSEGQ